MNVGYLTQNQLIALKLMADKSQLDTTRISDLIQQDLASNHKMEMGYGCSYYDSFHDILNHVNYYYIDGIQQQDKVRSNNRVTHPFFKILADQKVAYLCGNPILVTVSETDLDPQARALNESLSMVLHEGFDDMLGDWILGATKKGVEYLHPYIDPEGELQYVIVPAEQIIPVYDTQYQDRLVYVIRFYVYDLISPEGKSQQRYKVEWWTDNTVEYWIQTEGGAFVHDPFYEMNPAPHWLTFNTLEPSQKIGNSWGKVPFIPLLNNSEMRNDLHPIKSLIDAYDKVKSGWINDIDDFAEQIYVLKGFAGLSTEATAGLSQLGMFLQNLKVNRAIGVEAEGAVEVLKSEIPVEAKEKFLKLTRREIFYFGEGVDVSDEQIGNAPSGIALKFLYTSLDLKANRMIRKLKIALKGFMWFVVEYINRKEKKSYDYEQIIYTINKSQIFNEKEVIDGLIESKDYLSTQTILERHPYVDDVNEELARKAAEKKADVVEPMPEMNVDVAATEV